MEERPVTIASIELYDDSVEVFDIQVEEDESFIVGGVVVHNSSICRIRDGKRYSADKHKPIGHKLSWMGGPGAAHWNCRSTAIMLLKGQDELFGTRASADGQVDANLSYGEWLRRQSAETQDEVLGPTRGRLLREGKLTMDAFYNDKGRYLTLDELRARNAAAFARAGL